MVMTVGLVLIALGLYALLVRLQRNTWPITEGKVEWRIPDTTWRWYSGDLLYRGKKEEAWVSYEYQNERYSCRLEEKMIIYGGGFLLWGSKPSRGLMTIRVNPNKPSKAYPTNDLREWKYLLGTGVIVVFCAIIWSAT